MYDKKICCKNGYHCKRTKKTTTSRVLSIIKTKKHGQLKNQTSEIAPAKITSDEKNCRT
jgi:hypothetical protein